MKQSKFNLVYSGDTVSTTRLYDGIATKSIPVLFRHEDYFIRGLPFQCKIPWKEIVVGINRTLYTDMPVEAINRAIKSVQNNES